MDLSPTYRRMMRDAAMPAVLEAARALLDDVRRRHEELHCPYMRALEAAVAAADAVYD